MTSTLTISVAEAGDDCILELQRLGRARPYRCRLTVSDVVNLLDALTRARQWMLPMVQPVFTATADWRSVADLALHIPTDQRIGTGTVVYLVRHPAHGWLAGAMLPARAREVSGALLAYASMANPHPQAPEQQ